MRAVRGEHVLWRGFKLIVRYGRVHPVPLLSAIAGATVFAVMSIAGAVVLGQIGLCYFERLPCIVKVPLDTQLLVDGTPGNIVAVRDLVISVIAGDFDG